MDRDIRRAADPSMMKKVGIERPHSANVSSTSGTEAASPVPSQPTYHEPVSEGEEDDEYLVHPSQNEAKRLNLPPEALKDAETARAFREKKLKAEAESGLQRTESARRESVSSAKQYGPRLDIDPLAPAKSYDAKFSLLDPRSLQKLFRMKQAQQNGKALVEDEEDEEDEQDEEAPSRRPDTEYMRVDAPIGKRVSIPVRVEPKVIFANERTFLKWLHFGILIAAVATTLLNFIQPDDTVGLICAACFTITALLAILYAAGMYTWRVICLRRRHASSYPYYDPYGPSALCACLVASVVVNLVLRLREL